MNEVEHYEIAPGAGPSGIALGAMVSSFWDKNLEAELKFGLMHPHDCASRLSASKHIEVSVTELRKLEALDGSAGKVVFLWGTCRLEVHRQKLEFFAVYYPNAHFGRMDIGPKLDDDYGQEAIDEYKSIYASDD